MFYLKIEDQVLALPKLSEEYSLKHANTQQDTDEIMAEAEAEMRQRATLVWED